MHPGTLHFLCGKMAAGKTTCARALVTSYCQAPSTDEGFHVVAERAGEAGAAEA